MMVSHRSCFLVALFVLGEMVCSGCGSNSTPTTVGNGGSASQEEDAANRIVGSWEEIKTGLVLTFTDDGIMKMTNPKDADRVVESKYVFTSDNTMVTGPTSGVKHGTRLRAIDADATSWKVEFYGKSLTLIELDSYGKEKDRITLRRDK